MPARVRGGRSHEPRRDAIRSRRRSGAGDERAGIGGRCRGLRRPARPVACARPPAEGRPRQNFDPGARGPVSRLHRGGRKLRLELAADYLVMAAWLAYLKSRLLLPEANAPEGQSAEDMAIALALRLKRLEAIRDVA